METIAIIALIGAIIFFLIWIFLEITQLRKDTIGLLKRLSAEIKEHIETKEKLLQKGNELSKLIINNKGLR